MRSTPWFAVLSVLLFGVGWTSRVVAERTSDDDLSRYETRRERGHRSHRNGGGRFLFQTVENFATELELTEEQRAEMNAIWEGLRNQVREQERVIFGHHREAERQINAVLSEVQRNRLEELLRQSFQEFREAKLAEIETWLNANSALTDPQREQVLRTYRECEQTRYKAWTESKADPADSSNSPRSRMRGMSQERDQKLREVLTEAQLDDLHTMIRSLYRDRHP